MPVFGPGGEVVAANELAVGDLKQQLQPVMAALAIASRSLSRELTGDARHGRAAESPAPGPETAQALSSTPMLPTQLAAVGT